MYNNQTYSWVYMGHFHVKDDDDQGVQEVVASSFYQFGSDFIAIEDALQYKDQHGHRDLIDYCNIQLFLVTIDLTTFEQVYDYIFTC
jgi:hypothetical protein